MNKFKSQTNWIGSNEVISSNEIETQVIVIRRESERGLKDELSTIKIKNGTVF